MKSILKIIGKLLLGLLIIFLIAYTVPLPSAKKVTTPDYQVNDFAFPQGFFWGASTSSHQVEGGNFNDWTEWEVKNTERLAQQAESKFGTLPNWDDIKPEAIDPQNYISGKASGHYQQYSEDIKLMKEIGLNSYRFSIEWSRIEPEDGKFSQKEMDHYKNVVKALKQNGIEPFVTLWHRTQPVWVAEQDEWENTKTIQDFTEYAEYVAKNLGSDVKYYMTFNEPVLHLVAGYVQGVVPPEVKSISRGKAAFANIMEAHRKAYTAIHQNDNDSQVGSTQAMQLGSGSPNTIVNIFTGRYLDNFANWEFVDGTKEQTDFVGIQYYGPTQYRVAIGGKSIVSFKNFTNPKAQVRSDMGWEVYPHGIYELLIATHKRYNKPIFITENGIADKDDNLRAKYLSDHIYWVNQAMKEGAEIKGYMVWSLLDNFEWDKGFWPRFGLIEVDYQNNLKRTIRPSAYKYKEVIELSK